MVVAGEDPQRLLVGERSLSQPECSRPISPASMSGLDESTLVANQALPQDCARGAW